MIRIHIILHPTDFSETARQALFVAQLLARDHGAKLVLLHVSRPPAPGAGTLQQAELNAHIEEAQRRLAAEVAQLAAGPLEGRVVTGEPGVEIVVAARRYDADLIVMGTHSQVDIGRPCIGSVAEHVIRNAPCAVLTLKPGAGWGLSQEEEEIPIRNRPAIVTDT